MTLIASGTLSSRHQLDVEISDRATRYAHSRNPLHLRALSLVVLPTVDLAKPTTRETGAGLFIQLGVARPSGEFRWGAQLPVPTLMHHVIAESSLPEAGVVVIKLQNLLWRPVMASLDLAWEYVLSGVDSLHFTWTYPS